APSNRQFALALSTTQREMAHLLLRSVPLDVGRIDNGSAWGRFLGQLQTPRAKTRALKQAKGFLDSALETQAELIRRSNEQLSRAWQHSELDRVVATGRLLLQEGKLDEALKELDQADRLIEQVAKVAPGPLVTAERMRVGTYRGLVQSRQKIN